VAESLFIETTLCESLAASCTRLSGQNEISSWAIWKISRLWNEQESKLFQDNEGKDNLPFCADDQELLTEAKFPGISRMKPVRLAALRRSSRMNN
jgi:hypothetical protein